MMARDSLPAAVIAGLERYARQHEGETLDTLLHRLGWDALCGCWYFMVGNVFHGVEANGYIHT